MPEQKKPKDEEVTSSVASESGNKGKKPSRGRSRRPRDTKDGRSTRSGVVGLQPKNDFAFWNQYPELMNIAASYPWMHIAGTKLETTGLSVAIPNVAVQHFAPIPGYQDAATSPLNLAFRQLYLDMHRRYRGIGAYQASDIAITILCIESVLQLIIRAERIYGIINHMPIKTRIQPDGLLLAMGYSPSFIKDVKDHMANFRYRINRLIELARRLPLPKGMTFFDNHTVLNAFVYADSKDERANLIVFDQDQYFHYATTGDSDSINSAGTAVLKPDSPTLYSTGDAYLDVVETELNVLLTDSDILRITSDFIACYGEDNMQVLTPLPEDYKVIPTYSESILSKWHNSERKWPNGYVAASSNTSRIGFFAVYQENDVVYSMPAYCGNTWKQIAGTGRYVKMMDRGSYTYSFSTNSYHIVDTWQSEPDDEVRCESVLWKVDLKLVQEQGGTDCAFLATNFGTEMMTTLNICAVTSAASTVVQPAVGYEYTTSQIAVARQHACNMCQFDWHPYIFVHGTSIDSDVTVIYGDMDNVSEITSNTIAKIVDAALLSAFKVVVSSQYSKGN